MKWIERIPVDSFTSDVTYIVGISDKGEYGCSCPVWKFRQQECKHVILVKSERQASIVAAKRQGASIAQEAAKRAKARVLAQRQQSSSVAKPSAAPKLSIQNSFDAPRRLIQLEDD